MIALLNPVKPGKTPHHYRIECQTCGGKLRSQSVPDACPGCGDNGEPASFFSKPRVTADPVYGEHRPSVACGDLCKQATGSECKCACGGKNHGIANYPERSE